jgi:hypothetical protein
MIYQLWLRLKYWIARRLYWRGLADYDARWWHPDLDDGQQGLAYVLIKWRLRRQAGGKRNEEIS